jgi:hypothetical protein
MSKASGTITSHAACHYALAELRLLPRCNSGCASVRHKASNRKGLEASLRKPQDELLSMVVAYIVVKAI